MAWSDVPAGTSSITAVARDNAGATRTSSAASITVSGSTPPPTNPLPTNPPRGVVFNPSSNHDSSVNSYIVEFFASGANTSTATPVRAQDVGKPSPVSGEISVDVSATIQALPAGSYVAPSGPQDPAARRAARRHSRLCDDVSSNPLATAETTPAASQLAYFGCNGFES